MKLAFVIDRLEDIKISKDSSYVMMREAALRNHQVYVLHQDDIIWRDSAVVSFVKILTMNVNEKTAQANCWYHLGETLTMPLQAFDAVLMRKDPPFNMEYIYSTYLLELAEKQGARIINSPRAIRDFNETLRAGGHQPARLWLHPHFPARLRAGRHRSLSRAAGQR